MTPGGIRGEPDAADAAADFDPLRPLLTRVAYRMLGSVADAEDVVQDAFIRWLGTDRSADCYVQGDAAAAVEEIEAALAKQGVQRDGYRTAATKNALRGSYRDPGEFEIEDGTVH